MMNKLWNWLLIENNRKVLSFLGKGLVVVIAAGWTYFTYFDTTTSQLSEKKRTIISDAIAPLTFSGVYIGINTQGSEQRPTKITFQQKGSEVTGTYTLANLMGSMKGSVEGNKYSYEWRLGGFYGLGVSIISGNTITGTWGYINSDRDGGTITARLQ